MPYKHARLNDPALDVGGRKNPAKAEYIYTHTNEPMGFELYARIQ